VAPRLTIRPGHPDFLDLPWEESVVAWRVPHLLELPKGISRHEVRFLSYPHGIYVVKELQQRPARNDYSVLRTLEAAGAPAVRAVGLVENRSEDPGEERSAALITAYEPFSFSYREILIGPGFGARRNQMLDAFAGLLVALHLSSCYWGDCNLSNVLYRFDAEAIDTIMVDAETAEPYIGPLSDGLREDDLEIMIENVAGGMADIAAAAGADVDDADLELGLDIAERYRNLWAELSRTEAIGADERYRITERLERINRLGFDVEEVDLVPTADDAERLAIKVRVGGRTYHSSRLKALTGVDALENQARAILSDVHYYAARHEDDPPMDKATAAIRWRVEEFEPILGELAALDDLANPIQAYCDVLHHRYLLASAVRRDVDTRETIADWLANGRPGHPLG
jgi:Domain of unknown function (DUF4032)/Lipopolysaccharide kinase (Kdo/WaaP) family